MIISKKIYRSYVRNFSSLIYAKEPISHIFFQNNEKFDNYKKMEHFENLKKLEFFEKYKNLENMDYKNNKNLEDMENYENLENNYLEYECSPRGSSSFIPYRVLLYVFHQRVETDVVHC
eukprot:GHVL01010653.1.p1 GENE.GHVL01010653.1~~GHVL01010653.1.p1  ORF type:complete len:119 (+),score=25.33 GHVL01010653.1:24-380(+)